MNSRWFAPMLLAGALLGWLLATFAPDQSWLFELTRIVQTTFLTALKMIIAPLIFFSLISGVLKLRQTSSMGRLGGVTLTYYFATTSIAICIGLIVVFFIHPWTAYPPLSVMPTPPSGLLSQQDASLGTLISGVLTDMFANPFSALADLNILGILTSALLLGLAAAMTLPSDSKWPDLFDQITQTIFTLARWVLNFLPLGLFAIAHQLTADVTIDTMVSLGQFALVVLGATAFHGLVVLPLMAWWLTGISPWRFFQQTNQALFTAFITSSSAATLPLSLQTAEERLGVDRNKAAFVLPLGATINMDGTALFEGIAAVFLAYMFGIDLNVAAIVMIFLVTMLASAGAPGIPSGSMAGVQVVLISVGIPLEGIALLLLIERPLDTFRTAVNVEGDLIGSMIADKYS
ncbi:MAG: dicarboxylate/amino acid:cation symporter [Pseudomonadota bacterium]